MANINLITKFHFLTFLLIFFPARVEIDGGPPQKVGWGQSTLQVAPGQHHLTIYFPYLFFIKAGKAQVDVSIQAGQTATITYKAPWLVFLPGKVVSA